MSVDGLMCRRGRTEGDKVRWIEMLYWDWTAHWLGIWALVKTSTQSWRMETTIRKCRAMRYTPHDSK